MRNIEGRTTAYYNTYPYGHIPTDVSRVHRFHKILVYYFNMLYRRPSNFIIMIIIIGILL